MSFYSRSPSLPRTPVSTVFLSSSLNDTVDDTCVQLLPSGQTRLLPKSPGSYQLANRIWPSSVRKGNGVSPLKMGRSATMEYGPSSAPSAQGVKNQVQGSGAGRTGGLVRHHTVAHVDMAFNPHQETPKDKRTSLENRRLMEERLQATRGRPPSQHGPPSPPRLPARSSSGAQQNQYQHQHHHQYHQHEHQLHEHEPHTLRTASPPGGGPLSHSPQEDRIINWIERQADSGAPGDESRGPSQHQQGGSRTSGHSRPAIANFEFGTDNSALGPGLGRSAGASPTRGKENEIVRNISLGGQHHPLVPQGLDTVQEVEGMQAGLMLPSAEDMERMLHQGMLVKKLSHRSNVVVPKPQQDPEDIPKSARVKARKEEQERIAKVERGMNRGKNLDAYKVERRHRKDKADFSMRVYNYGPQRFEDLRTYTYGYNLTPADLSVWRFTDPAQVQATDTMSYDQWDFADQAPEVHNLYPTPPSTAPTRLTTPGSMGVGGRGMGGGHQRGGQGSMGLGSLEMESRPPPGSGGEGGSAHTTPRGHDQQQEEAGLKSSRSPSQRLTQQAETRPTTSSSSARPTAAPAVFRTKEDSVHAGPGAPTAAELAKEMQTTYIVRPGTSPTPYVMEGQKGNLYRSWGVRPWTQQGMPCHPGQSARDQPRNFSRGFRGSSGSSISPQRQNLPPRFFDKGDYAWAQRYWNRVWAKVDDRVAVRAATQDIVDIEYRLKSKAVPIEGWAGGKGSSVFSIYPNR